jgi:hypothetical protein
LFATTITNVDSSQDKEWQVIYKRLNNTNFGGWIETEHTMIIFAPQDTIDHFVLDA